MSHDCNFRSECPLNAILEIIGDRWSMLILRDIVMFEKKNFKEFMASQEGISSNILTDRLRLLCKYQIIERRPNTRQKRMVDYHITSQGQELMPAIQALAEWSMKYITGPVTPPSDFIYPDMSIENKAHSS